MNGSSSLHKDTVQRLKLSVRGAVQGVGFRPFVFRLALELRLTGWVLNTRSGVLIEVEGKTQDLQTFLVRLREEKPVHSSIQGLESSLLDPVGYAAFEVRHSDEDASGVTLVPADIATCPQCLEEIFDPANRRYLYPFTNCTHCGPRFTIIESLPYDRSNTTMKSFEMCDDCKAEYGDPADRRFHAQPIACPQCGPQLELWDRDGTVLSRGHDALVSTVDHIRRGMVVAVKGLGGFHLMVDARNQAGVMLLRQRKRREAKPLAVMFPAVEAIRGECLVSETEERLVRSPESPIVLLRRRTDGKSQIAEAVAPSNPFLGALLPYTPLHHILMKELAIPVVATSGNISDEPICIDEQEALQRLHEVADVFLVHNRPIIRHVDDSLARLMLGREQILRRARGYAPLPLTMNHETTSILAVGAHQKNTVALATENNVFLSQHIGDLETKEAYDAFRRVAADLRNLLEVRPQYVAADLHPDYLSTQYAREQSLPVVHVQHHYAHVASCMAENEIDGPVLGVSWDGTGYGEDGTIWGGEFLLCESGTFRRIATLRSFRLPGNAKAIKEPRRTALGLLHEVLGDAVFSMSDLAPVASLTKTEIGLLKSMIAHGMNSPVTTSMGRLFDAVASIANLAQRVTFEGQAAMELEFAIGNSSTGRSLAYRIEQRSPDGMLEIDWAPMIVDIIHQTGIGATLSSIAEMFHNTLSEIVVGVAQRIGVERVVLTGGCFQNRYLTERSVRRLWDEGFKPYWHQRVPPNDGGIALGQIVAASRHRRTVEPHTRGAVAARDSVLSS